MEIRKIKRPWITTQSQSEKKTDKFYHSPLWRKLRAHVLAINPLCYYCNLSGLKTLATVADHFRPRKIFPDLELQPDNIKGSCDYHHNQKRQWERTISNKDQFERLINDFITKVSKP